MSLFSWVHAGHKGPLGGMPAIGSALSWVKMVCAAIIVQALVRCVRAVSHNVDLHLAIGDGDGIFIDILSVVRVHPVHFG